MSEQMMPELAGLTPAELGQVEGGCKKNEGFLCAIAYAAGRAAKKIKDLGDDTKWFS